MPKICSPHFAALKSADSLSQLVTADPNQSRLAVVN